MYKYLFFDLDGTIVEPSKGIVNSILYALDKLEVKDVNPNDLLKFIGPPLEYSFMNFLGFSEQKADEAVRLYREYYKDKGINECHLYEGIDKLIINLANKGYKIVLATSKPEPFAIRIIERFNLLPYFTCIAGATLDGKVKKKEDVINNALKRLNITNLNEVIMIGDRKHDIIGANINNLDSIGVLYGFGNKQEFIEHKATYIVNTVTDLYDLIISF